MSDTNQPFWHPPERSAAQTNVVGTVNAQVKIALGQIRGAGDDVAHLTTNLNSLKMTLQNFGNPGSGVVTLMNNIKDTATAATTALSQLMSVASNGSSAAAASPSSTTSTTYTTAPGATATTSSAAAWSQQAVQQASNAVSSRMPGGITAAGSYLKGTNSLAGGLVMGGLRFLRDRIATARDTALQSGGQLGMVARQQGTQVEKIMDNLAQFPGNVMGTPEDLLSLFQNAPQLGASFDFQGNNAASGRQGPRAAGFLKGVSQAQMMNPAASVTDIMGTIGGFAADTGAQQQGAFLTGGAMSMIKAGGRQKSLTEWAEDVMHWFEGLRPGNKKGVPFDYGELMAQYFPGSNIDAWFTQTGVSQDMRNYWWTYALQRANKVATGDLKIGQPMEVTPDTTNVDWQRLRSTSELTRTQFNLGAQLTGDFINKEQANRWFNQMLGSLQTTLIPAFTNSIGRFVQYLPDTLEEMMMSGIEGMAAGDASGDSAWGVGDIGDSGGYGATGGTGLAGLSPNMKSKLGPMMRANPRLKINSGLRDNAMQKRLKDKGYSRVSGKPSAHTRGDAADLGPSNQYGWIIKNAKRFGLKSGVGEGEPWHVGVGDAGVGDAWDTFMGWMGNIGGSAADIMGVFKRLFSSIFDLIPGFDKPSATSPVTTTSADDFYNKLVSDSSDPNFQPTAGLPSGGAGGGGGTSGSWDGSNLPGYINQPGRDGGIPLPAGGGPGSAQAGKAAATALFNAGFRNRKDLETITAISWRESKWNPLSKNQYTSDRGLMQINMAAHKALMQQMHYTEADLMDEQKNANIAYRLWSQGGGNYASFQQLWGFSEHSPYSEPVHGQPGWDKNGDPLGRTQGSNATQVVASSGLPVVGDVGFSSMAAVDQMRYQAGQGTSVTFHNVFNLDNTGTSSGGGMDIRRTASRVADVLEAEMNKRLARSN